MLPNKLQPTHGSTKCKQTYTQTTIGNVARKNIYVWEKGYDEFNIQQQSDD